MHFNTNHELACCWNGIINIIFIQRYMNCGRFAKELFGSIENKDPKTYENEDPLRKRRSPTKTKIPYENKNPFIFCRK